MRNIYDFICKTEMFIAKITLALLSLLVLVAAIARTFHYPIMWAMDAATFLFAWTVFFGADIALRLDRLFCIEIVTMRLSRKAQLYLKVLNYLIIMVFLMGMIGYGSWLSYTTRLRTFQGIPGFSYTWVTISVPIGSLLMLVTVIGKIGGFLGAMRQPDQIQRGEQQITEVI